MIELSVKFESAQTSDSVMPGAAGDLQVTDKNGFFELMTSQPEQELDLPELLTEPSSVQTNTSELALIASKSLQTLSEHLPQTGTSLPLESGLPAVITASSLQRQTPVPTTLAANKLLLKSNEAKAFDADNEALLNFDLNAEQPGLELSKLQLTKNLQDVQLVDFKFPKPMSLPLHNQANNSETSLNSLSELMHKIDNKPGETSSLVSSRPLFDIGQNISSPQWNQALGQRMLWLVNNKVQSAEIQLDPPQLGRLDVQIRLTGEHAQINFSAEQLAAKESLELSLPKLREMLAEAGFNRVDVNVSQQQHKHSDSHFSASNNPPVDEHNDLSTVDTGSSLNSLDLSELGVIDYYA